MKCVSGIEASSEEHGEKTGDDSAAEQEDGGHHDAGTQN